MVRATSIVVRSRHHSRPAAAPDNESIPQTTSASDWRICRRSCPYDGRVSRAIAGAAAAMTSRHERIRSGTSSHSPLLSSVPPAGNRAGRGHTGSHHIRAVNVVAEHDNGLDAWRRLQLMEHAHDTLRLADNGQLRTSADRDIVDDAEPESPYAIVHEVELECERPGSRGGRTWTGTSCISPGVRSAGSSVRSAIGSAPGGRRWSSGSRAGSRGELRCPTAKCDGRRCNPDVDRLLYPGRHRAAGAAQARRCLDGAVDRTAPRPAAVDMRREASTSVA